MDREVLHATLASFLVPLIDEADLCINNATKSMTLHAFSFIWIGEQLLRMLYELFNVFNESFRPNVLGFMNEKLAKPLDDGS